MIANINTISSGTSVFRGLLQVLELKLRNRLCSCCCASQRTKRRQRLKSRRTIATVLRAWIEATVHGRVQRGVPLRIDMNSGSDSNEWKVTFQRATMTNEVKKILIADGAKQHEAQEGSAEAGSATLHFFQCKSIALPHTMGSLRLTGEKARVLSATLSKALTPKARAGLQRFRDVTRSRHRHRAKMRNVEFDFWFVNEPILSASIPCIVKAGAA